MSQEISLDCYRNGTTSDGGISYYKVMVSGFGNSVDPDLNNNLFNELYFGGNYAKARVTGNGKKSAGKTTKVDLRLVGQPIQDSKPFNEAVIAEVMGLVMPNSKRINVKIR